MTFRVTLRWRYPKTDANGRTPTKELESAKSLTGSQLCETSPCSLGFRDTASKNPSLSANQVFAFFLSNFNEIIETQILSA